MTKSMQHERRDQNGRIVRQWIAHPLTAFGKCESPRV